VRLILGEKDSPGREPTRTRADVSSSILERLTTPMHDFGKGSRVGAGQTAAGDLTPAKNSEGYSSDSSHGNEVK